MARIRSIKPEFCTSQDTGALNREARLFFVQLFMEADDEGRMLWIPRKLCGDLYPHDEDVDAPLLTAWSEQCAQRGMLTIYELGGVQYLQITNWNKHQKISHPTKSRLPPLETPGSLVISRAAPDLFRKTSGASPEALRPDLGSRNREQGTGKTPSSGTAVPSPGETAGSKLDPDTRICEIVKAAYHSTLPNCRAMQVVTPKGRKKILWADKLASQVRKEQGWEITRAEFWSIFFSQCLTDPWLRGDLPNPKNSKWKQNLLVLIDEERFAEIMNRALAAPGAGGDA